MTNTKKSNTMETIQINKSELEKAISRFSKFTVETSGMQICCAVSNYIRLDDELDKNRPAVYEVVQKAKNYKNIFPNQISQVSEFIMSVNDERFRNHINNLIAQG